MTTGNTHADVLDLVNNAGMEKDVAEWLVSVPHDSFSRGIAFRGGLFENVNRGHSMVLHYIPEFAQAEPEFLQFGSPRFATITATLFPQVLDADDAETGDKL